MLLLLVLWYFNPCFFTTAASAYCIQLRCYSVRCTVVLQFIYFV